MSNTETNIFHFHNIELRITDINGEPWFVGHDATQAMDMRKDAATLLRAIPDDEKLVATRTTYPALFGVGRGSARLTLINESGLYKLIMRARRSNPKAVEFQDWVTKEVLPSIRKHGGYVDGQEKMKTGEMSRDEYIAKAVLMANSYIEELKKDNARLEEVVEKQGEGLDRYHDRITVKEFGAQMDRETPAPSGNPHCH